MDAHARFYVDRRRCAPGKPCPAIRRPPIVAADLHAKTAPARHPMFTTRPEIRGTFGLVTSTHWVPSAVGMAALERGGHAFAAGVACGFTLPFVEPPLHGPGGDTPPVFYSRSEDRLRGSCAHGPLPGTGPTGDVP